MSRIPISFYRIQFNPEFGFKKAGETVEYLSLLGISDIYASPIFHARKGSSHGYDLVDLNQLNPELGNQEDFRTLAHVSESWDGMDSGYRLTTWRLRARTDF
jgi:(1->4)-alpha-D-glucan 1-alpha-D-glucosylmutase